MKRKRSSRAKNKISSSPENSLIKPQPDDLSDVPRVELRVASTAVRRAGLFNAELEEAIEIIARERVYRAMLAGLGRRLLMGPQRLIPPAEHDDILL